LANSITSISIFWSESADYIAIYSAFSFLFCLIIFIVQFRKHSNILFHRLVIRVTALMLATIVLFTLCLFISGWHSHIFGNELITSLMLSLIWLFLLYKLNCFLILWSNKKIIVHSTKYAFIQVFVLVAPFILFSTFILILGSQWTI
jgi:hypothetical protein